jgi:hypothetical protein
VSPELGSLVVVPWQDGVGDGGGDDVSDQGKLGGSYLLEVSLVAKPAAGEATVLSPLPYLISLKLHRIPAEH